jgi:hypothetical protein
MTWFQFLMLMSSVWWCSGIASDKYVLQITGLIYLLLAVGAGVAGQ